MTRASPARIILILVSMLWIVGASLIAGFLVILGTAACGAVCGKLAMAGLVAAILFILLLIFAVRLLVAAVTRRISDRLLRWTLIVDGMLLVLLSVFVVLLASG